MRRVPNSDTCVVSVIRDSLLDGIDFSRLVFVGGCDVVLTLAGIESRGFGSWFPRRMIHTFSDSLHCILYSLIKLIYSLYSDSSYSGQTSTPKQGGRRCVSGRNALMHPGRCQNPDMGRLLAHKRNSLE